MRSALAFVVILMLASLPAKSQEKDLNILLQKAFASLKEDNQDAFIKLFPSYEEMKDLILQTSAKITDSSLKQVFTNEYNGFTPQKYSGNFIPGQKNSFNTFLKEIKEKGIDTTRLEYIRDIVEAPKVDGAKGYKKANGIIVLKNDKEEFELSFSEVVWSEKAQGWFGINLGTIKRK
jgi:hypothetical protein